jgi:serine/threonine protein phosphatase PrpC
MDRDRSYETGHVQASNQDPLALLNDCGVWIVADALREIWRDRTFVGKLVQRGLIDAATALTHPERHILTTDLGDGRQHATGTDHDAGNLSRSDRTQRQAHKYVE